MQPLIAEQIKALTSPFMDKGFVFSSLYEKGGDSSCVYICRYKKGRDFFDWREVSGGDEINIVVYVDGVYDFPTVKRIDPKAYRDFCLKHIFRRASMPEKREFVAAVLCKELASGKPDFLGIKL